jgi:hypothetical protein
VQNVWAINPVSGHFIVLEVLQALVGSLQPNGSKQISSYRSIKMETRNDRIAAKL